MMSRLARVEDVTEESALNTLRMGLGAAIQTIFIARRREPEDVPHPLRDMLRADGKKNFEMIVDGKTVTARAVEFRCTFDKNDVLEGATAIVQVTWPEAAYFVVLKAQDLTAWVCTRNTDGKVELLMAIPN